MTTMATVIYMTLSEKDYRNLELQMRAFAEETHNSGGSYRKSIRLRLNDETVMEFHGPPVRAYVGAGDEKPTSRSVRKSMKVEKQEA